MLRQFASASCCAVAALFLFSPPSARSAELAARLAARNSVTSEELESHTAVLAADTFEGREAGSRGGRAAAGYLIEQFEKLGLQPAGPGGSYAQTFHGAMRNLLGLIPGSDPQFSDEVILIGAHYDHVGYGTAANSFGPLGRIHNGADDNASGVSALLEAAQAFKLLKGAHKRTVLFALWDGEEKGLLGSQHWISNPTLPLQRIRCAINLDMVGRLRKNKLEVYGSRTAVDLRRRIAEQNAADGPDLDFLWRMQEDSDHYNFYRYNIPTLMFHTGKHDQYHRPSDDVETLNYAGIQTVARLTVDLAIDLADGDELSGFRVASTREGRDERLRTQLEQPLGELPGRLGITWNSDETGERGITVATMYRRSAAADAGIVIGDRIVAWNGKPLKSTTQFQSLISTATEPVTLSVVSRGRKEPRAVEVTLDGAPIRVGITWIRDEAEPRCVLVKRVFPASPAARAGLQSSDRIYAVGNRPFTNGDDFERLLLADEKQIKLTVERSGKMIGLTVTLDPQPTASAE